MEGNVLQLMIKRIAIREKNFKNVVSFFIKNGIFLNRKDQNGETLLHKTNSLHEAKVLIESGWSLDIENNKGETPLDKMIFYKKEQAQKNYRTNEKTSERIKEKYRKHVYKHKERFLLRYNYSNKFLIGESSKIAFLLVEKGANLNIKDQNGKAPIHKAIEYNRFDIASIFLIKKGCFY